MPQKRIIFLSIFGVNDFKWIIDIYIYHLSNKKKRLLISYSNLEVGFNPFLAHDTTPRPHSPPLTFGPHRFCNISNCRDHSVKRSAGKTLSIFDCSWILRLYEFRGTLIECVSRWICMWSFPVLTNLPEDDLQPTDRQCPPPFPSSSLCTFHTLKDRKGLKQTFLKDSGKTLFADIVYSQNFVWRKKRKKKEKTNLL